MITFHQKGDFSRTEKFLVNLKFSKIRRALEAYGRKGVAALASATPVDTGKTASSWEYHIETTKTGYSIYWNNTNVNDHVNIALIIQFGHGTKNGGWVEGRDYINPALQPIFDEMANTAWKEVTA